MDNNKIFDNHIHFNDYFRYKDANVKQMIEESYKHNVGAWLCASFDLTSSKKAVELSEQFEDVYVAVAIHPNEVSNYDKSVIDQLDQLANHQKVVAIGETGLDYYYTREDEQLQKNFLKIILI